MKTIELSQVTAGSFIIYEDQVSYIIWHGAWPCPFPVKNGVIANSTEGGSNIDPSHHVYVIPEEEWGNHGITGVNWAKEQ